MERHSYKPMLLRKAEELPEGQEWIYESKLDGYRMLGYVALGDAHLITRHGNDFTDRFPTVAEQLAVAANGHDVVVDGEIIAYKGRYGQNLYELQRKNADAYLFMFDLLELDGHRLTSITLETRRIFLEDTMHYQPNVLTLATYKNRDGLIDLAAETHEEGVVAKRRASIYREDQRDRDWQKWKFNPSFQRNWNRSKR